MATMLGNIKGNRMTILKGKMEDFIMMTKEQREACWQHTSRNCDTCKECMSGLDMAEKKLTFSMKFNNYEDACEYVRKHIIEDGWIFEQKWICTGVGCHIDNNNEVKVIGYSW